MQITKETVRKIAHLARLEFKEADEEKMQQDLNNILTWMEKLQEIDTENVEPLTHMSSEINVMREDAVGEPLSHERGLLNAPKKDSDYFRVPKVME
jgi:aspartyl-tRNA(Asn)/glutamyl-tRNA(Gln) amidotransferase subunit C